MEREVGKVKPSSNFRELLARVDSIRNNSSDCGEYTDGQTEELANLCTQLVDSFNHIVISLEDECDRLRDGPRSMIESDSIYYRDNTCLAQDSAKYQASIHIQSLDGKGLLHFTEFRVSRYHIQEQLLNSGEVYVCLEFIHQEKPSEVDPSILAQMPSATNVAGRMQAGLRGLPTKE
ncbi:MAG: hypothetical protein WC372_12505 [Candidatus Neomarinimicrobiota bacterium]